MHHFRVTSISLLFAATAFLISCSNAQPPAPISKMDSLLDVLHSKDKAMCSVAIAKNGKIEYARAIGYAQISPGNKIETNPETKYRIGSISKMFTATMIMQLVDEKKLSLDAHLSQWFPEIPHAAEITIDQMLSHHSGIHSFTDDEDYLTWCRQPRTEQEIVAKTAAGEPAFLPGEKGAYSNANFVLLGYIIEKLTGDSYPNQLSKRITSKIGLKNTTYGGKIDPTKNMAASYRHTGDAWTLAEETDMSVPGGAGAIISTPTDLVTFITALFQGKLVSKTSLATMKTMTDRFGRGMFEYPFYLRSGFGHTGGIDGFASFLMYFPDDSVALAITSNGTNTDQNEIAIGVLSIYYKMPYTLPTFDAPKAVDVKPELLEKCVGTYATKTVPMKISVTNSEKGLRAQATGQGAFPLTPTGALEFQFEQAGIKMTFHQAADGAVNGFTLVQHGATLEFAKE